METFLAVLGSGMLMVVNGLIQRAVKAKDPRDAQVIEFIKASDPLVTMVIVGGAIAAIIGAVGIAFSA